MITPSKQLQSFSAQTEAYLEIPATTIDLLFVLRGELSDKVLATVVERLLERGRESVKAVVLKGLQADGLLVGEPFASRKSDFAKVLAVIGDSPALEDSKEVFEREGLG